MDQNLAIKILRKNFEKLVGNHLKTLRFLVSQLYKLFDSIITISVAVVGIIVPIILSSDYPVNTLFLWLSFGIFIVVILVGIFWRFISLKVAENKYPKILENESENFHKSVLEIRQTSSNNFLEIIQKNFQFGNNRNAYRTKMFEVVFVTFFCLGIILLAFSLFSQQKAVFENIGEFRLELNADKLKLLSANTKGQLGRVFIFQENDGSIATTLSVENPNIEGPSFRIVKGYTRDWLVVTTIENSGTGYLKHIDTWYVANPYYQANLAVLSYPSDGHITGLTDIQNQNLTTRISKISSDDKKIDIEFTIKTCEYLNTCEQTTKMAHFVWDDIKDIYLILDDGLSGIDEQQIKELLVIY